MKNFILVVLLITGSVMASEMAEIDAIAFAPNETQNNGFGKCDCTDTIVEVIDAAKCKIIVQAYNFTSEKIAASLIKAKARGVDVQIIGDRSVPTEKNSQAKACSDAGIKVFIDKKHKIAHNKVMVIDDLVTITGSFNFTDNAEKDNAENLLIIKSDKIAAVYTANWNAHCTHSEVFK